MGKINILFRYQALFTNTGQISCTSANFLGPSAWNIDSEKYQQNNIK